MKREVLKSLALKAKNRMIHKGLGADLGNGEIDIKVIKSEDEVFESKVRELLREDENVVNPIKKLMDEAVLLKLDGRGREKYLLETIEKYHEVRKRIERESMVTYGY